jgi:hypothetical protein
MTAALLALALAAPLAGAALEDGGARYRAELAGEHVGWAELRLACRAGTCEVRWESALRLPGEAGGGTTGRRVRAAVARADGAARGGVAERLVDGRARTATPIAPGHAPASVAELLLARAEDGERRCVRVRDEESGREGEACARRDGAWLEGEVLGEPIRFRSARAGPPEEVDLPAQRMRFVADARAELPARAPRLYGTSVALPRGATRFCGVEVDPPPPAAGPEIPRAPAAGASCRERAASYLRLARRAGLEGRLAVGVAFDGQGFVWHAWTELLSGGRWIPVDPSFEQVPAEGPRFTLARYDEEDGAARAAAGRRVLACWGVGR